MSMNRDLFGAPRWKIVPDEWDQQKPLDIREDHPAGRLVASVAGSEAHGVGPGDMWEHATLIAQAPLLLSLLREARDLLDRARSFDVPGAMVDEMGVTRLAKIDAAIAAATTPVPARAPLVKRA